MVMMAYAEFLTRIRYLEVVGGWNEQYQHKRKCEDRMATSITTSRISKERANLLTIESEGH
jgi:hypothetical protein